QTGTPLVSPPRCEPMEGFYMSANIIRLLPDEERALLECYVAGSQHPASFQQLFDNASVLAFASWLEADAARDMEHAVNALRARGVSFAMTVTTLAGRILEAKGQVIGGRAILRLREVSGIKYELAELARRHQKHVDDTAA